MKISMMKYVKASCLGCALITQPLLAGPIALGPNYSTFDNLIIVGLGATDIENCDHLLSAIANTSGTRTIKLPPATYDCTTDVVDVPDNVTLEGSGQKNTFIKAAPSTFTEPSAVVLNNGSELRYLTVENNSTGIGLSSAINIEGDGNRLTHVTVLSVFQGTGSVHYIGVLLDTNSTNSTLNDVTIRVDNSQDFNHGIFVQSSGGATLNNVNILALGIPGYGIFDVATPPSGSITIRNSVINGSSEAIGVNGGTPTYSITHTQLINGVTPGTGTFNCFGAFDENHSALTAGCVTPP